MFPPTGVTPNPDEYDEVVGLLKRLLYEKFPGARWYVYWFTDAKQRHGEGYPSCYYIDGKFQGLQFHIAIDVVEYQDFLAREDQIVYVVRTKMSRYIMNFLEGKRS